MTLTDQTPEAQQRGDHLLLEIFLTPEGHADPYSRYAELHELRGLADYLHPFELFAQVLGPRGGRRLWPDLYECVTFDDDPPADRLRPT